MQFKQIWFDLPNEIQQLFELNALRIEYKRGDIIYREGDIPKGIYFIVQGLIGLNLLAAASGKEHLVRFFKSGQFFGHRALFSEEGYHGSTVVIEPSVVSLVPKKIILRAMEQYPVLYKDIAKVLAKELRRSEIHYVTVLENEILARVAQSLIYLKDLNPDHHWTRQEIANFCASTTSTVIKAMAELEMTGFISQSGREIVILNRQGLIDLQDQ